MQGMTRNMTAGLVSAVVFAAGMATTSLAQQAANTNTAARRPMVDPDPRVQALRDMQKRVTVTLDDARLEDVMMFIEQAGNLQLDIAWLDTDTPIGLQKDALVTVNARNMTIQSLLEFALDRTGDEFSEATWQLTTDGIIEVGPKEWLNSKRTVKLYDIQDLLFVIPNFTDVPELDLDAVLQQSGGGGGGRGVFRVDEGDDLELDEATRAQEIMDIVTSTIDPEQWQINGGTGASVRFYRGSLLVSAPGYIHRQLGGYDFRR
jgi:hypothetical protein